MTLTPRQQAALSVLLAVSTVALFCLSVVRPALSARASFSDRLEALQLQYQRFVTAASRASELELAMSKLDGLDVDQAGFLVDRPHALAAAELQAMLGSMIGKAGGNLLSTQVLESDAEQGIFPEITVRVRLYGNTGVLQRLLYEFTSYQPLLVMDNLLVQQRQRKQARAGPEPMHLEIGFDASAFVYRQDPP
ncbi:MAG: type II secretion system protein GspM [Gammaproteobacteria bacterium]|nr:type II secretion system protein GspM [Gammaproteobacteria bacterium]MCY4339738.1 type II secretion system protein GspM [Gammaproteobacteria bacterium]